MSRIQLGWMVLLAVGAAAVVVCQPDANPGETDGGGTGACVTAGLADSDDDGVPDRDEGMDDVDTDRDGQPDARDLDSDDDGRADADEAGIEACSGEPIDSDGDGAPDFRDTDSDGNGVSDGDDGDDDSDGDGVADWRDPDDDGDGITDAVEIGPDPTDPADTDGDGTPDVHDADSDNDSIADAFEGADDADADGLGNFRDTDSDADGFEDRTESGAAPGFEPVDTDGDGAQDFLDADSDDDGLFDWQELEVGTSPTERDTDGDRFTDSRELECGSDPLNGTLYPTEGPCVANGCGPSEECGDDGAGDGTDDDCDGQVDEGCTCPSPGATQPCYDGVPANRGNGICTDGEQTCTEFNTWGACEGGSGPQPEVCGDDVDQDCSGADETCCEPFPECFCVPGAARYCDDPIYCRWGIQYCNDAGTAWGTCVETDPPEGCSGMMYDVSCCVTVGACCQDYFDIDTDGDNQESMGECIDILCPACSCDPGDTRYCQRGWSMAWGIQSCEETELGWSWGTCEPADPPETCAGHATYAEAGQRCCAESGYCCQDAGDLDYDGDRGESAGDCNEPECCLNELGL
jgi:hypothetical protein